MTVATRSARSIEQPGRNFDHKAPRLTSDQEPQRDEAPVIHHEQVAGRVRLHRDHRAPWRAVDLVEL